MPDRAGAGPSRRSAFIEGALDVGARAAFAYPLRVGTISLGVLDLYRDLAGMLTDVEYRLALDYAGAATAVLLHLQSAPGASGMDGLSDPAVVVAAQNDLGTPVA